MAKKKFTLEFDMRGTPQSMLWMYVATPSGLDQWFADEVEQDGKKFTFYWDKYPTEAMLLSIRSGERAKYRWVGDDDKSYIEFKITVICDTVILLIYIKNWVNELFTQFLELFNSKN